MSYLKNSEIIFNRYDLGLTKTKKGLARIHSNAQDGNSGRIATIDQIILMAVLDQLITLNIRYNDEKI